MHLQCARRRQHLEHALADSLRAEKCKQTELVGVLFRNCFVDERSLFDDDHLIELAVEVDLDADEGVRARR